MTNQANNIKCIKCGLYAIRSLKLKHKDRIEICYKCGNLNWVEVRQ